MAEVTRRCTGELLRALFDLLMASPEGLPARSALQLLEQRVTLTGYEKGEYDSGGRRFEKIVRFATVDCVKAGWRNQERRRLTLIDIRQLYELWIDHYKSLSDEARRRMPLRPAYFLSPEG